MLLAEKQRQMRFRIATAKAKTKAVQQHAARVTREADKSTQPASCQHRAGDVI